MKRMMKGAMALGMSLMMTVANMLPMARVFATDHGEGEYRLTLSVDSNADWVASLTVNGENYVENDVYLDSDGTYYLTIELHVPNDDEKENTSVRVGGGSGPFTIQQAGESEDWEGTHRKFTYTASYTVLSQESHVSLNPFSEQNQNPGPDGPQPPAPQGDIEAVVKLRGGEGSYMDLAPNEETGEPEEREIFYTETYVEAAFAINGGWPNQMMPEDEVPGEGYSQMVYHYDSEEEDETVDVTLMTLWHMRFVDDIIINGHSYPVGDYINYDDQKSYLDHYSGQVVSFTIEGVAKAEVYDITVKVKRSEHTWIGNFLWTADPTQEWEIERDEEGQPVLDEDGEFIYHLDGDGNRIPGRDYIGHSSLALVAVEYEVGGTVYRCNADEMACEWWDVEDEENVERCEIEDEDCVIPYIEFDSGSEEYDDGALVVPAGARVTMKVFPDYGYQVMGVEMMELETSEDGIGEFTFTVPEGAAYFVADVVPVEDVVATTTEAVTGGVIDLGEGQTTLNHGSARLEVKDAELTDEDKATFEDAAEGYAVKTYLDISLYNVTCKGGETCEGTEEDAWNERVRDLNEAATITLQLEEGVDGNEIVIVHEKHDGTYEIIPSVYDPETQTITFTTTSFSNYAIASRTVTAPETGGASRDGAFATAGVMYAFMVAMVLAGGAAVHLRFVAKRQ